MNKHEFLNFLIVLYRILKDFPPFDAFLIIVAMGKRCIYIYKNYSKRKNNATFKGKQRDNINEAMPPPTFSGCCRNLKSKKTIGRE
jgi:hypothetical protein